MTSERKPTAWTPELVAERLRTLKARTARVEAPPVPDLHQGYREAAAVLAWFDPTALRPFGRSPHSSVPPSAFLAECTPLYDTEDKARWSLKPDIRRQALRGLLKRSEIAAALAANPERPDDELQRTLERYLLSEAPVAEQVTLEALSATLQVAEWLDGLKPGLPDLEALRQRLALAELLKPLRRLTGEHFRGRQEELEQLRRYTGVIRPESLLGRVELVARKVLSLHERPPLVIHGPGGMGKSTLVARFILEHVGRAEEECFPVAYLDFDHPALTVEEPLTLLAELFRQVGLQYPAQRRLAEEMRESLLGLLKQRAASTHTVETRRAPLGDLVYLLKEAGAEEKPFLLVLDTFEEVQYTSGAYIGALFDFLNQLQQAVPRLRTVLAGRAPAREFASQSLALGELDPLAAEGFLAAHGIEDAALARAVVAKVGGNPLSLKLAAEVARKEGVGQMQRTFLPFLREARIQGQLYQRILGHIHDADVRKLAHPGLALRVVTPELIAEVLAEPCGVDVPGVKRARVLFKRLAEEAALVTVEGEVLRHRQDVRRVMLELLRADEPEKTARIHRGAVAFHARHEGTLHRAEELYHRLCLEEEPRALDPRWLPELAPYLRSAVEEVPPRQRAWLAARLGIDLDEQTRAEADLADWERDAEKRVREHLHQGTVEHFAAALAILREREDRTEDSPLLLLEARVLEGLDRLAEARRLAQAVLVQPRGRANNETRLECYMLLVRIESRDGKLEAAKRFLASAQAVIMQMFDSERHLQLRERLDQLSRLSSMVLANERRQVLTLDKVSEALSTAFPARDSLEQLLRFKFNVPLSAISEGGTPRRIVFDVVSWVDKQGKLPELIEGARSMNPGNRALQAVAQELLPASAPVAGTLALLPQELLREVVNAVVDQGLTRARQRLLDGIESGFVASLPVLKGELVAQLTSDLRILNQTPRLKDGSVPLRRWLQNAMDLAGGRREGKVFMDALKALKA